MGWVYFECIECTAETPYQWEARCSCDPDLCNDYCTCSCDCVEYGFENKCQNCYGGLCEIVVSLIMIIKFIVLTVGQILLTVLDINPFLSIEFLSYWIRIFFCYIMTSTYNLCRRTGQLNSLPTEAFMKHIGPCPPGYVSVPIIVSGVCTDWKFCIPKEQVMNGPSYPCDAVCKTQSINLYGRRPDSREFYPRAYYSTNYPRDPLPKYDGTGYEDLKRCRIRC